MSAPLAKANTGCVNSMIGLISAILLITIGLGWKYSQHKDAIALTKRWQHEDLPRHEADQAKRMS